jgi:hypothetical protein
MSNIRAFREIAANVIATLLEMCLKSRMFQTYLYEYAIKELGAPLVSYQN